MRSVRDHGQALTLDQLGAELMAQQLTKVDYVADTRRADFYVREDGDFGISLDMPDTMLGFGVNDIAHEQIGSRIGIPRKYYDRMRADAPELLVKNVGHWFMNEPEDRMFRTLQGNVRAVVSNRFRALDNLDLLQHLLPVLRETDGLEYWVTALTPERMYLRATLPRLQADVKVGDTVQAGVEISNSEVGRGSLQVKPWILRLDCLNGLTTKVALRKYHAGRRIEQTEDALGIFRDETLRADDTAFFMMAADMAKAALTETTFNRIVDEMRETTTGETIVKPVEAVKVISKQLDLREEEGDTLLNFLAAGGDLSQWGAVNALTETAKYADTFERVAELEAKAGDLVAMPANEWAKVAVAA